MYTIHTGVKFFDHMLQQLTRHSLIDLTLKADGDLEIDAHHTVEDTGIVLGQAFCQALGSRQGIMRFAHSYAAMDETLSRVVLDLSGRPFLIWKVDMITERIGEFDTQLVREWFQGFTTHLGAAIHVSCLYSINTHHQIESCYKALGLALREAIRLDPRRYDCLPSTKGLLVETFKQKDEKW